MPAGKGLAPAAAERCRLAAVDAVLRWMNAGGQRFQSVCSGAMSTDSGSLSTGEDRRQLAASRSQRTAGRGQLATDGCQLAATGCEMTLERCLLAANLCRLAPIQCPLTPDRCQLTVSRGRLQRVDVNGLQSMSACSGATSTNVWAMSIDHRAASACSPTTATDSKPVRTCSKAL
jgi:hypothetical protein